MLRKGTISREELTRRSAPADPCDPIVRSDARQLATFVRIFCTAQHGQCMRAQSELRADVAAALPGSAPRLCTACAELLCYAIERRLRCPYDPKPMCKKCPTHCYRPDLREQMRAVMRFSGTRLVLRGRLDYLFKLFG